MAVDIRKGRYRHYKGNEYQLIDAVTHNNGPASNPIIGEALKTSVGVAATSDMATWGMGQTPDPLMTNIYKGTSPRVWSGTWQIIPQSMLESAAIALMLMKIKKWGSPDTRGGHIGDEKVGFLTPPYTYKIVFGNPFIQNAMRFNEMALQSYSINYFAQGYASTYKDLMPKQIELTLSFSEFGIKYRTDWGLKGIV